VKEARPVLAELAMITFGMLVPVLGAVVVVVTARATWAHWRAERIEFAEPAHLVPPVASVASMPRLRPEEHWQRVSHVVRGAIDRSTVIAECQRRAVMHVGVAELALDHLQEELAVLLARSSGSILGEVLVRPSAAGRASYTDLAPIRLAA
jgi:hypothetical protein